LSARRMCMHRAAAVVGSVLFLVVAPGTLVVLVPFWISGWRVAPPLVGFVGFRVLGALLMAAGLPVLLDSFARFALEGVQTGYMGDTSFRQDG